MESKACAMSVAEALDALVTAFIAHAGQDYLEPMALVFEELGVMARGEDSLNGEEESAGESSASNGSEEGEGKGEEEGEEVEGPLREPAGAAAGPTFPAGTSGAGTAAVQSQQVRSRQSPGPRKEQREQRAVPSSSSGSRRRRSARRRASCAIRVTGRSGSARWRPHAAMT
jgi:hypothetical protein